MDCAARAPRGSWPGAAILVAGALLSSGPAAAARAPDPTSWTAELSGGLGTGFGQESYEPGPHVTARVSWGGRHPGIGWFFYVVGGLQLGYLWAPAAGDSGRLRVDRTHLTSFVELRAAAPIAFEGRTRLFVGLGGGVAFEALAASRAGTAGQVSSETWRGEIRLLSGIWHQLDPRLSLFANYRLRTLVGGSAPELGELGLPGSDSGAIPVHEVELGCAVHF